MLDFPCAQWTKLVTFTITAALQPQHPGDTHTTVPHLPGPHPPPTAKTGKSFEALQHEQCYLPAAAELQQKGNE